MPEMTSEEKKEYQASLTSLESYPGGKLAPSEFSNLFGPIAREENRKRKSPTNSKRTHANLFCNCCLEC